MTTLHFYHFVEVALYNVCTNGEPSTQCSDTNAACLLESGSTSKCLCSSTFYQNDAGNCVLSKYTYLKQEKRSILWK